jgi:hypothetical protein
MYCRIRNCGRKAKYIVQGKSFCERHCNLRDRIPSNLFDKETDHSPARTTYTPSESGSITPGSFDYRGELDFDDVECQTEPKRYSEVECQSDIKFQTECQIDIKPEAKIGKSSETKCQIDIKPHIETVKERELFSRPLKLFIAFIALISIVICLKRL